jgi:hypothetical protein
VPKSYENHGLIVAASHKPTIFLQLGHDVLSVHFHDLFIAELVKSHCDTRYSTFKVHCAKSKATEVEPGPKSAHPVSGFWALMVPTSVHYVYEELVILAKSLYSKCD